MSTKALTRQDTRQILIQAGADVMIEKGYTNSGIQEVLSKVGVPKGSFYHYFNSKEDFAVAIIEEFERSFNEYFQPILNNKSLTPTQRLRTFCTNKRDCMQASDCRKGCLIGNLSQEMSDQSETLRQVLSDVMTTRRDAIASCIEEGQLSGEFTNEADAQLIAELFLSGWEGAMMRAKTIKNLEPLNIFIDLMFELVLKK